MPTPRIPLSEWTDPRHVLGWETEVAVGRWLERRGWSIAAHRWRLGRHDIDLIARRGPLVAFIEVKVRNHLRFGAPEEAVGPRKRQIIERTAWCWILRRGRLGDAYRFDVAAVTRTGQARPALRYIEDAWRPGWR